MIKIILFCVLQVLFAVLVKAEDQDPFLGTWQTEDKSATIEIIFESNKYSGKILSIDNSNFWQESENKNAVKNNKLSDLPKVVGEKLVFELTKDKSGKLTGGKVRDFENKKDYSAKAEINGDKLSFRFYSGTPIFGQTDNWTRLKTFKPIELKGQNESN